MEHVSDSESYRSSPTPESKRPNRWTGDPATYRSYIEQERGLAASLNQIRDQDLSIHLYNSYALKRRARRFAERKDRGEVFDEELEGMGWSPPKAWTAWPLAPNDVPREEETVGEDDGEDLGTFKRPKDEALSAGLEDLLVATTLRFAKEKFAGREQEDVGEIDEAPDSAEISPDDAEGEESSPELAAKEQSEPPDSKTPLKPIISADDDRASSLLRPSIRHTLSKLDSLLLALHHARETCHQINSRPAPNPDEAALPPFNAESLSPTKRPRGRPRKFDDLALLPKDSSRVSAQVNPEELFRAKKSHLGRPLKDYPKEPNESDEAWTVRIARLQKKALPSFAAPLPVPPSRSLSVASGRSRSANGRSPARPMTEELSVSRKSKLGLRDWSEVLGMAALVGFKSEVVEMAVRRCVGLLGEGVVFRRLTEGPYSKEDLDTVATYQPDEIPDFGSEEGESEDESEEDEVETSRRRKRLRDDEDESYFCPLDACRKMNRGGFEFMAELRRHMRNAHKLGNEEISGLLGDEEMDGAVHLDGFLEPMRCRRGVRGEGKKQKGNKNAGRSTEVSAGEDEESEDESGESSSSSSSSEGNDGDADGDVKEDIDSGSP